MKNNEIENFIANNQQWLYKNDMLIGKFSFKSFAELQSTILTTMNIADELKHHPTVIFAYDTLEIQLQTHDAGNKVTELDLTFAQRVSDRIGA